MKKILQLQFDVFDCLKNNVLTWQQDATELTVQKVRKLYSVGKKNIETLSISSNFVWKVT